MRILYITHTNNRTGAPIALLNVMKGMKDWSVEVALVSPEKNDFLYEECRKEGITTYSDYFYEWTLKQASPDINIIDKIRWFIGLSRYNLRCQWYIYKVIKAFRPDIVHCNSSAIDYALLGCKLTNTPHVWHVREYLDKGCDINIFPSMKNLLWKMARNINHSIAISQGVFDHYKLNANKDCVIYDGVLAGNETYTTYKDIKQPYFVCVGYFNKVKYYKSIVEQFAKIAIKHKDVQLVIVGSYEKDDSYFQETMSIAENLHIKDRIHLLGTRNDVLSIVSSAIALINAAKFEGFGFTTVEAMYVNTLVIGRDSAGTKEQFDTGLNQTCAEIGLRFIKDDELPSLMERALTEDFSDMKARARKVVLCNYTIKKNVDCIYSFYQKILKHTNSCTTH